MLEIYASVLSMFTSNVTGLLLRFNAAVPFVIVVIVTLVGMILGGRQAILELPEGEGVEMSLVNIFTYADSVAALIWASCLASVVLFIMLRVQRILKLSQFMEVEFIPLLQCLLAVTAII